MENMPEVLFNEKDVAKLDGDFIDGLIARAAQNPRKRMRLCLHKDIKDDVHEMIIAMAKESYVRPHKHIHKTESFHVIRGSLWLFIFDNEGNITEKFKMSEFGSDGYFLYRLEKNYWHTMVPITDFVVFHEVTKGPFTGKDDSVFPKWAPHEEETEKAAKFIKKLLATAKNGLH